jgi:molecular chaperone GrpE
MDERRRAGAPADPPRPAGAPEEKQAEAEAGQATAASAASSVERDLDALEETKRERDEYLELAQRTRADFENYRKRIAAETGQAARRGKAELARELIGVIDNLERALVAAAVDPAEALTGEVEADGALEQGALLTYRELHAILKRAGVEAYDPAGEPFDPAWHEALSTRSVEGAESGTVLEVLEKGYRLDGQVIRAARVVVSE